MDPPAYPFEETSFMNGPYEKLMRFKKSPQLPGAGRTRTWHHHESDTPTSPRAIYVLKSAKGPNIFWGSALTKHLL